MLTAAELRELLSWPRVEEELDRENRMVVLLVQPTHPGLDDIYLGLDEERSHLEYFGFGPFWHSHPDEITEAVDTARLLIRGEQCMIHERDAAGKTIGSGLYSPDGLPDTMSKEVASLCRVFFDREPVIEPIDFTRYFRGAHIWLSLERKAEIERMYRDQGMPLPEW